MPYTNGPAEVAMSPPYIFRIDELREHPNAQPIVDNEGFWIPSTRPGYNVRVGAGVSGAYWLCDGTQIYQIPETSLPSPMEHYKSFSVFYSSGRGFRILRGDGTSPPPGETWQRLCFDHDSTDCTSYLTNAGVESTLLCQRTDQEWPRMLLPDIYHGPPTVNPDYGGLIGDLPIFLALVAFSMAPEYLAQWIPWMYSESRWRAHKLDPGRYHKRGVVVYVYTCPPSWKGGSTEEDLREYEEGQLNARYFH